MNASDKRLVPCFLAALVINIIGVLAVANSSIFSPERRVETPKPAERPAEVLIARRIVPTPKPPEPTPTPKPTPPRPRLRKRRSRSERRPNQHARSKPRRHLSRISRRPGV